MKQITFITSLLTFYLKGSVKFDNNFIRAKVPNTILKLIPLGSENISIPCTQVSHTNDSFKLRISAFIWGIIIAILGFNLLGDSFLLGLLVLLYGIITILSSFEIYLTIANSSGKEYNIRFLVFEKSKMYILKEWVEEIIDNRLNDTNTRVHTERQTEVLVDALKNR